MPTFEELLEQKRKARLEREQQSQKERKSLSKTAQKPPISNEKSQKGKTSPKKNGSKKAKKKPNSDEFRLAWFILYGKTHRGKTSEVKKDLKNLIKSW
jgi:hypothetical protein